MNWINYIENLPRLDDYSFEFYSPVNHSLFSQVSKHLNLEIPEELKEFYLPSNGIGELLKIENKPHPIQIGYLILKLEEAIQLNLNMQNDSNFPELYMPFNCLFFFSNAGNGDLFGYRVLNNKIEWNEIYCWNHETDERVRVANNLYDFITKWTSGKIKI